MLFSATQVRPKLQSELTFTVNYIILLFQFYFVIVVVKISTINIKIFTLIYISKFFVYEMQMTSRLFWARLQSLEQKWISFF